MWVVQVNIGQARTIESEGDSYHTGIYKEPVDGPVAVSKLGLKQDVICEGKYHGGVDQAVYLYSSEDYGFWSGQLGRELSAGAFGENLTTSGLDASELHVGDLLTFSDLTLQVTAPRIPCNTLESKMGERGFLKQFMKEARSGAYCRVLKEGMITAGDEFTVTPFEGDQLLLTLFFADISRKLTEAEIQRYLTLPIDERNRAEFEDDLARYQ